MGARQSCRRDHERSAPCLRAQPSTSSETRTESCARALVPRLKPVATARDTFADLAQSGSAAGCGLHRASSEKSGSVKLVRSWNDVTASGECLVRHHESEDGRPVLAGENGVGGDRCRRERQKKERETHCLLTLVA